MKQFWIRLQSALIYALVMGGGILWHEYSFGVLFLVITFLSLNEYYNIIHTKLSDSRVLFLYRPLMVISGLVLFMLFYASAGGYVSFHIMTFAPLLFFLPFILELFSSSSNPIHNIGLQLFGFVYLGISFAMVNFVVFHGGGYHAFPLLGIIVMIWAYDSFAYLVGSRFGKRKLFPRLSPKKSWEGLGGGVVGIVIAAGLLYLIVPNILLVDWLLIGALIIVTGTFGDLVISLIKRSLQIKDTGSLIPGHGGILDRFDALILTIPFAAVYIFFRF